jgi:hypothetical protein
MATWVPPLQFRNTEEIILLGGEFTLTTPLLSLIMAVL